MAFAIYEPQSCDWRGGTLVEIVYPWAGSPPYRCIFSCDLGQFACYGAEEGKGADLTPRGKILRVVTPRLTAGWQGDASLAFSDSSGQQELTLAMAVGQPFYPTFTYTLRKLCPAVWSMGPRELAQERPL